MEGSGEGTEKAPPIEKEKSLFFLVGPPRSGTKLLRAILNQAQGVAVAPESHIYPKFLQHYEQRDPYSHREEILERIEGTLYMERLKRNDYRIELDDLVQIGDRIQDVIRRFMCRIAKEIDPNVKFVGDKTPSYSHHILTLHHFFPEARFVAIVRDPRDRALSISSSWGKSSEMAALNWREPVRRILEAKKELGKHLHLIKYEELLEDPELTVKGICEHLGIAYEERMLQEADSTEKFGSVQRMKGIQKGNAGKYWEGLSQRRIRSIEAIVLDEMRSVDYPVHFAEKRWEPGPLRILFLRAYDLVKNMLFHVRHKGLKRGLPYMIRIKKDKQV
jgi:hypothetical protein